MVRQVSQVPDESLLLQVVRTARACRAPLSLGRFYQDDQACFGKFGNKACPFLDLCATEHRITDEWPDIIKKGFRQEFRAYQEDLK